MLRQLVARTGCPESPKTHSVHAARTYSTSPFSIACSSCQSWLERIKAIFAKHQKQTCYLSIICHEHHYAAVMCMGRLFIISQYIAAAVEARLTGVYYILKACEKAILKKKKKNVADKS
jgi:hypothetical protein